MLQRQTLGVQQQTRCPGQNFRRRIQGITPHRVTDGLQVNPQLVRAAGLRLQCQQRAGQGGVLLQTAPPRDAGLAAGVDDVVRKPVAIRELLARVEAIRRRVEAAQGHANIGPLRVFFDGRDPELEGNKIEFPRRERRILEYLVTNRGKRVTKSQLFNAVYGLFDDHVQESVIESHVSKLRKKLVACLGEDPIDSKRFLGYCLM